MSISRRTVPLALASVLLAGGGAGATLAAAPDALTLERKIPLGDVAGRLDHFAIDQARQRLFVAELGNNTVGVVDLRENKVAHRLSGLKEPQGVAYVPGVDTIYVANAGDGSVHRFKGTDFSALGASKLGDDADNIRIDGATNQIVVGYGSGALALLDSGTGSKVGDIRLAAHPESFQLEKGGARAFVNVPDAGEVAVVDRTTRQQVARWKLAGLGGNFPMAFDEAGQQLAVVYRRPATLAVFDTRKGDAVTRLPTCRDADDVFFDGKRHRLYVSCGEGVLDVVEGSSDGYRELARIPTVAGARTSLWVPELDRLFLGVRARGGEPAAVWVYRPEG